MAKFRDLSKLYNSENRAIGDRQRHFSFVKEQMMANLPGLLEEINIFRSDKKISDHVHKITLKMAREYRFVFDDKRKNNNTGIGQSDRVRPGDILGKADSGKGSTAGDMDALGRLGGTNQGTLTLELTPEEIDDILDAAAQDLNLPFLSNRRLNKVDIVCESRWRGLKEVGIDSRLDLEATFIEKIRREKILSRGLKIIGKKIRAKFIRDDLRYHGISVKTYPRANVLIVYIMDVSGSMDKDKRYFAKSFCYALYNFIRIKYQNAEKIFIAHDTDAKEVDSDTFFRLSSNGGTFISSGPRKAVELIKKRFDPENWDIYCVHCSDGENNSGDERKIIPAFEELVAISTLVGFLEIKPGGGDGSESSTSRSLAQSIKSERFKTLLISDKRDVRKKFDEFLSDDTGASFFLGGAVNG